jgi:hypothetical protein
MLKQGQRKGLHSWVRPEAAVWRNFVNVCYGHKEDL